MLTGLLIRQARPAHAPPRTAQAPGQPQETQYEAPVGVHAERVEEATAAGAGSASTAPGPSPHRARRHSAAAPIDDAVAGALELTLVYL
jgi:hypothetical protein